MADDAPSTEPTRAEHGEPRSVVARHVLEGRAVLRPSCFPRWPAEHRR